MERRTDRQMDGPTDQGTDRRTSGPTMRDVVAQHPSKKMSSFLAVNIKKCIMLSLKRLNLLKLTKIKNEKLYFSRTFQKVE